MQVPLEDNSIDAMKVAIREVQRLILGRTFSTYTEIHQGICNVLKKYEGLGGGVALLRLALTKNCENLPDMDAIAKALEQRCDSFMKDWEEGPKHQINDLLPFVRSTSRIWVHGCGHLLALAIACAVQQRPGVHFYIAQGLPVTDSRPNGAGQLLLDRARQTPEGFNLKELLPSSCTIVPDSAMGALMTDVDFVLMGANSVTEHGGLVHLAGSLQIAIVAQAMRVPCYVLCETFKFTHNFPLSTKDLRQPTDRGVVPTVEFVPPSMITLVFSEEGIMPPSAVADEMFRNHVADRR
jgi:translation initiation factor eIF-2B subunit alpha